MQSTSLVNQPYDEAVEASDPEDERQTPFDLTNQRKRSSFRKPQIMSVTNPENNSDDESEKNGVATASAEGKVSETPEKHVADVQPGTSVARDEHSDESDDDEDDDDDDDDGRGGPVEGAYDPAEFENLDTTPEIKELFSYITRYTPQSVELDHKLRPFVPDYIPAVGDIDAFVKVTRPDGKPEILGLTVLDEPSAKQSDPFVLDLQLRAVTKQSTVKTVAVKTLDNAEKSPKEIDSWIKNISELHKSKPPPTVHYSRAMPDVENLMQEWDPEFEELLKEVGLPSADLDCSLAQYVDMACGLLDIPIHKSRIQSLHVLFTLFSEFKNSQHFRQLAQDNLMDNADKQDGGIERLVLQ